MLPKEGSRGFRHAGFPRDMRSSIRRGLSPLLCSCFPFLYTQPLYLFTLFYFVFVLSNIPANAKTLSPINRDYVHVPPTFVPRYPLSLERLSHPTSAFTITHLPVSEDCSTIWVIVDRYTKMAYFVPGKNAQKTAEGCAKLFLANVWKLYGLQSDIVSDRDLVFTSTFWVELM